MQFAHIIIIKTVKTVFLLCFPFNRKMVFLQKNTKESMRILHTADWHLGVHLGHNERTIEHALFLQWLLGIIDRQAIDVLVIAGDVFDTGNPSNTALKQYYDFLWQVKNTCCRDVVILGGNHDSASTLNAPRDLLRLFRVHVAGCAPDHPAEQLIEIKDSFGSTQMVICAVPFLRDREIGRASCRERV